MTVKLKAKDGDKWIRFTIVILTLTGFHELYSKHFKTHYNGKPTKWYLKLMRKINDGERIPISEMKTLLL
jgi:hypothetical protein